MFERFTEPARRSLFFARYEASMFGSEQIDIDHLRLGILRERREVEDLIDVAVARRLRDILAASIGQRTPTSTSAEIPFSRAAKATLEQAVQAADAFGHGYIGGEHLWLATMIVDPLEVADDEIRTSVSPEDLRTAITRRSPPS